MLYTLGEIFTGDPPNVVGPESLKFGEGFYGNMSNVYFIPNTILDQ